ncbi:GIY-YIG nuclease family protein [Nocardia sp. NPDC047038]|uniref:GIY-YIG nuclease family protein n=1 Tax=Nocardia sp. NPDC047038 TaxID=3154338 RepID=UPI0033FE4434
MDSGQKNHGKTVRMFLADGTPGGLQTAEIMNWTGHIVAAPRSDLARLLARREVGRTGVYVLIGEDPDTGGILAYIGEGDEVGVRIRRHAEPKSQNGKDFWDRAIVITSKDANITKAHARYLEARLIQLAQQAGRAKLVNGTAPPLSTLPEADISDMESFIAEARIVLPVLNVNIFRSVAVMPSPSAGPKDPVAEALSPVFEMAVRKCGITATAQEIDGEFVVRAGSLARSSWSGWPSNYQRLHQNLVGEGVLKATSSGEVAAFTRDYPFSSPSAAAAVVAGRNTSGRESWRIPEAGTTFGDWQNRET